MSKTCAICGEKITVLSENKLSKDYPRTKICFTCYEYAATAMKGSKKALEILRSRYRDDISDTVVKYIDSLDVDIAPKKKDKNKDEFMDLVSNDLSKAAKDKVEKKKEPKANIIRLDKLTEARKDKLIRVQILSKILLFVFLVCGLLFSFYILTQGYGAMLSVVTAVVSIGFSFVFHSIGSLISALIDE